MHVPHNEFWVICKSYSLSFTLLTQLLIHKWLKMSQRCHI